METAKKSHSWFGIASLSCAGLALAMLAICVLIVTCRSDAVGRERSIRASTSVQNGKADMTKAPLSNLIGALIFGSAGVGLLGVVCGLASFCERKRRITAYIGTPICLVFTAQMVSIFTAGEKSNRKDREHYILQLSPEEVWGLNVRKATVKELAKISETLMQFYAADIEVVRYVLAPPSETSITVASSGRKLHVTEQWKHAAKKLLEASKTYREKIILEAQKFPGVAPTPEQLFPNQEPPIDVWANSSIKIAEILMRGWKEGGISEEDSKILEETLERYKEGRAQSEMMVRARLESVIP